MDCSKHIINGIVSLVISVGITVAFADEGEEYGLSDVTRSVAIAAFFSGLFTSYFANDS